MYKWFGHDYKVSYLKTDIPGVIVKKDSETIFHRFRVFLVAVLYKIDDTEKTDPPVRSASKLRIDCPWDAEEVFTTLHEICHHWFRREFRHLLTFLDIIDIMLTITLLSS